MPEEAELEQDAGHAEDQQSEAEFAPSLDQRISSEASAITMAERFAMSR